MHNVDSNTKKVKHYIEGLSITKPGSIH